MSAGLFYTSAAAGLGVGERQVIDGAAGHHGVAVRRLEVGEQVTLSDGAGTRIAGEVSALDRRQRTFEVVVHSRAFDKRAQPRLFLVQALMKDARQERTLEMATELGVDTLMPWQAERSILCWEGPRAEKGRDRWLRTCRSAAQQSRRSWIPTVSEVASTAGVLTQLRREPGAGALLVLWERSQRSLAETLAGVDSVDWIAFVVGPEGGFTDGELAAWKNFSGAQVVNVGPHILRSATAGVAALAAFSAGVGGQGHL